LVNIKNCFIFATLIPTSWDNFFDFFADSSKNDFIRYEIGTVLLTFLQKIYLTLEQEPFDIWINGSFTTRKEIPNDVDILIHIPSNHYDKFGIQLRQLINNSKKESNGQIDAYLIVVLDNNHKSYPIYQIDLIEWQNIFGKTKPTRSGQRFSKGILKITFNEEAK
jgi:hypothetical protein